MKILEIHTTPNRKERRMEKRIRTSSSLNTKKWTLGRLRPFVSLLRERKQKHQALPLFEKLCKR